MITKLTYLKYLPEICPHHESIEAAGRHLEGINFSDDPTTMPLENLNGGHPELHLNTHE